MKTVEVKIYKYEELSDEAKEKARAWFREGSYDCDWYDSVYELLKDGLFHGGVPDKFASYPYVTSIEVKGFDLYRRSIDVTAEIDYRALLEEHAKAFVGGKYTNAMLKLYDADYIQYHSGSWHWYGARNCTIFTAFTDTLPTAKDIAQEIGEEVLSMLQAEADYIESDENVEEGIRCNEYDFTEDGKVY